MKKLLISFALSVFSVFGQSVIGYEIPDGTPSLKEEKSRTAVVDSYRSSDATIPHLAYGGTWTTKLIIMNLDLERAAKLKVEVFNQKGERTAISLLWHQTGQVVSGNYFEFTLPLNASMVVSIVPDFTNSTKIAWLRYDSVSKYSDSNYGGYGAIHAIFSQKFSGRPDLEAVVFPDWGLDKKIMTHFDNTNGFVTSVAVCYDYATSYAPNQELIVKTYDENGALMGTHVMTMKPGNQFASETFRLWPETANKRGTIVISATQYHVSTVSLLFNPSGSLTSSQFYGID